MTEPPRMDVTSVTIGAPNPRELAIFYARMLGWPIAVEEPARPGFPAEDGWAQLRPPDGKVGPRLNIEYEAHYMPPVWRVSLAGNTSPCIWTSQSVILMRRLPGRWRPAPFSPPSSRRSTFAS